MVIRPAVYAEAMKIAKIIDREPRYKAVEAKTGVNAGLIGALHTMESDRNFSKSFFNGDDGLRTRTYRSQPYGQPKHITPPYTWQQVAIAALAYDEITAVDPPDDYGQMCADAIKFNGYGYERHGIASPYGFAGTNLYKKGKFVADSRFSPNVVSNQIGACVILKAYEDLQFAKANPPIPPKPQFVPLPPTKPQFVPLPLPQPQFKPLPVPPPVPVFILTVIHKTPPKNPAVWNTIMKKDRTYEPLPMNTKLSHQIKMSMFTKGGARPFPNHTIEMCYRSLAERLESVSVFYGGAGIRINSGYRPPSINLGVGGAPDSRHTGYQGCAADVVFKGVPAHKVYKKFSVSWTGGLGDAEDYTHFDLRELNSRWNYNPDGSYMSSDGVLNVDDDI